MQQAACLSASGVSCTDGSFCLASATIHNDATQEPLLNLAPKKVNWDLKRDLEQPMKKLRAMTDRATIEIIQNRVETEQQVEEQGSDNQTNLAAAVAQQEKLDVQEED